MIPSLTDLSQPIQETAPQTPASAPSEFNFGSKQMAVVGFVVVSLLALVGSVSYLAGRITSGGETPLVEAPVNTTPEQVVIVEAVAASTVKPAPSVQPKPIVTAPAVESPVMPPLTQSHQTMQPIVPQPNEVYYQVAAVDRGMAEVSVEFLKGKGLSAKTSPSPDPAIFRVLVGPLGTADQLAVKNQLEAAGFKPFLKRF